MDDILSDELRGMFNGLMGLYDQAYGEIRKDVEYIVLNDIRDDYILEHVFDKIINIPTDKCYELFVELCDYVSHFNEEMVEDYKDIYNELYGDDKETNMTI